MNRFIIWLLTTTLLINQATQIQANQHYSYANAGKEDHHHHQQETPHARRIYQVNSHSSSNNNNNNIENNQASQLKLANTIHNALAAEVVATYSPYANIQQQQQQQPPTQQQEQQYQQNQQTQAQPLQQIHTQAQAQPQPQLTQLQQQHPQQHPHPQQSQPYQDNKYTSVQYNVLQSIDDADIDIVYHQMPQQVDTHNEATQQEKPSLLDQLKSQQQELSEGYATFLQEAENGSSNDNQQQQAQQQQQQLQLQQQHIQQQQQSPQPQPQQLQQHQQTQLTNPQLLHYQKLQEQQQLYYQTLQQEELLQQQQYQQQLQQYQQQQAQQLLQQQQQQIQQQAQQYQQVQQIQQQLQQQQQQLQQHYQQQRQQQPQPPHPTTAYVTPTPQSPATPHTNPPPPPPPPSTAQPTPAPVTTTQATVHPNLHHHHQQQSPAIVSHATTNEASPASQASPSIKPFQRLPPQQHQRNKLPEYATVSGIKYAPNSKPYNHPPAPQQPPTAPHRHPAAFYGPPPPPPQSPHGSKHSKQVIYAPMRFVYDRKLPYSSKTFPYPPSFISLTTTERPMKYDNHGNPGNSFYSYDHKTAYNKVPDLFVHRSSKSLLDSYIPSWQVIKMLQQFQHQTPAINQNANLQTLAMPFRRNFKRSAADQGKQQ